MSKDPLLSDLARLAREEDRGEDMALDERWDRLAAGTLTAEEEAELKALAATSPEARDAYEAFRPLGAEFEVRMVAAAAAELSGDHREVDPRPVPARVLPFQRPAVRLWGSLAAASAVAASLLLLLRGPGGLPHLPVYTAELSGGSQILRGGDLVLGPPVFTLGSLLTLEVRPAQSVNGLVEARSFLTRGEEVVRWEREPPLEVAGGAVRLRGTLGEEIRLPAGDWRLWIVLARPGEMPSPEEVLADRERSSGGPGWQAISVELRVEGLSDP